MGLEQVQIISSTVENAMHMNGLTFDRVENEIVLYNEVAISHSYQLFFVWDSPKMRMLGEKFQILFDLCCNSFSSRWFVGGNVGDDVSEVFFGAP